MYTDLSSRALNFELECRLRSGISSFTCRPGLKKNGATTTFLQFLVSINFRNASAMDGEASSMCAGSTSHPSLPSLLRLPQVIAYISAKRSNSSLLDFARLPWSTRTIPTFSLVFVPEDDDAFADECAREHKILLFPRERRMPHRCAAFVIFNAIYDDDDFDDDSKRMRRA